VATYARVLCYSQALALGLLLFLGALGSSRADPPAGTATGAGSGDAQVSDSKGGFMSSIRQAFGEDFDREVVRGHFDVGSPPDAHRYYCLVDTKTGKREPNGVAGQLTTRRDGMTGIKGGAVAPLSCADAEQKGLLVTSGYVLKGRAAAASVVAPPPAPAAPPSVASAPAVTSPAAVAPPAASVAAPAAEPAGNDVMATYARFIAGQNAHDAAAVAAVLLDSKELVWAQYGGQSIWGRQQVMEAFQKEWQGTWKLDPQLAEARVANPAPGVAVLITPLLYTFGDPGASPVTVPIRWGGVFVKTPSGWRIASMFVTPFKSWHEPKN
jgi:ketosteroid isomerase-like protein